jgi:dimeric dUTPase (all-alpha-NTP-PPase superfamily)
MQEEMQIIALGDDWRNRSEDYATAVFVEAAECINHLGWEWWKQPTPNIEQARMELVDMLHFVMCGVLIPNLNPDYIYEMLENSINSMEESQLAEVATWSTVYFIKEATINSCIGNYLFAVYLIDRAATTLGMDSTDLFNAYVGKNILNRFRKANGYKQGTYIKIWDGKEDNEVLTSIISSLDPDDDFYIDNIMLELQSAYNKVKAVH